MGRIIFLTGATGKFGNILTKFFLESGDTVIAVGRTISKLNQLKSDNLLYQNNLILLEADLRAEKRIQNILNYLDSFNLKPNCLINCARNIDFLELDNFGKVDSLNFLNEFDLSVVVPYELTVAFSEAFEGVFYSAVNVGSIYGLVVPNLGLYDSPLTQSAIHYGVGKAALVHLTKELAVRLVKKGVRVNCVSYGGVLGRVNSGFESRYANLCPGGRMLKEEEIPGPIDMMLSDSVSAITGHNLIVDQGWTLW